MTESHAWHEQHIDLKTVVKEGSSSNTDVRETEEQCCPHRHVSGVGTVGDI